MGFTKFHPGNHTSMTLTDVILLLLLLLFLGICKRENVWGTKNDPHAITETLLQSCVMNSSDWLTIPCCATGPLSDVQVYCTQKSFWLCPCCCWVRCLWWCRTGDKRERSLLWGESELDCFDTEILSAMGLLVYFPLCVLTCPHNKHHNDDDELPCSQLGGLAHFLHCHFVWRSQHNVV